MVRGGGINEVLVAVEPYRREKQPLKDRAEEEFVFELCNALSSCLMDPAAKAQFVEDQGVELMMLVLKGRQYYRIGVLKVRRRMLGVQRAQSDPCMPQPHSTRTADCLHAAPVHKWRQGCVQALMNATTDYARAADLCIANKAGLPTLFGIFMGKNKTRGVKAGSDDARQQLESTACIIANLMHYTTKRCAPRTRRRGGGAPCNVSESVECPLRFFSSCPRTRGSTLSSTSIAVRAVKAHVRGAGPTGSVWLQSLWRTSSRRRTASWSSSSSTKLPGSARSRRSRARGARTRRWWSPRCRAPASSCCSRHAPCLLLRPCLDATLVHAAGGSALCTLATTPLPNA